jgi:catalase-peroxidase
MGSHKHGVSGHVAKHDGREDVWEPDETYWRPERTWLAEDRYQSPGRFDNPFGRFRWG